ncbi:caspase family protein [Streptomyces sp. CHD11]|uniref:caspase family protein n=1 Tax=Streptomyces sp. CHD11 TaxID=2741325 RepID=UPI001BFC3525|nr:caspase family protein [Streptomyces sp. CHD11]MBT3152640.1 caspase family protein [Streptomyces sp. CHD11]
MGTAHYRYGLPDIPPVAGNVDGLARIFRDPGLGGLGADTCHTLADPTRDLAIRQIAAWCREAEDVLVVYFSGHGLIGEDGELLLACEDTDPDMSEYTALPISLLRKAVQASPARTRVLILDCCYSGRAIRALGSAEADLLGQVELSGTYTLASAPGDLQSLFNEGERYTVFTGELIDTLRNGIAEEGSLLSVGAVYRHLLRTLRGSNLPEPRQVHSNTAGDLALVHNAAYVGADPVPRSTGPQGNPFRHVDLLVRRAGEDTRDRLVLRNAARDHTWPVLARLRMVAELDRLGETGTVVETLRGLGVSGDVHQALRRMREFSSLVEEDRLWESQLADSWNVGTADDPDVLWGLMMAIWLSASGLPVDKQTAAVTELVGHGYGGQARSVLKGMLGRGDLPASERRAVQAALKEFERSQRRLPDTPGSRR